MPLTHICGHARGHRAALLGARAIPDVEIPAANPRGAPADAPAAPLPQVQKVTPVGERVLVKVLEPEAKSAGGILLPTSAQKKPTQGEVVEAGTAKAVKARSAAACARPTLVAHALRTRVRRRLWRTAAAPRLPLPHSPSPHSPRVAQAGDSVVYSKYAGTELELGAGAHVLLKEDDVIGKLAVGADVSALAPLADRVLVEVVAAEDRTAGGLLLTEAAKEKPNIGKVGRYPGTTEELGTTEERAPALMLDC